MKRALFFGLAFVLSISTYSQEFNGIPVDGGKSEFLTKLKSKGYILVSEQSNVAKLIGTIGTTQVSLLAAFTPETKLVYRLIIEFPDYDSWPMLKNDYDYYLKSLVDKYGEPTISLTGFQNPYKEGDGNEIAEVRANKCEYIAFWSKNNLGVKIENTARVNIIYEKKINLELLRKENRDAEKQVF